MENLVTLEHNFSNDPWEHFRDAEMTTKTTWFLLSLPATESGGYKVFYQKISRIRCQNCKIQGIISASNQFPKAMCEMRFGLNSEVHIFSLLHSSPEWGHQDLHM